MRVLSLILAMVIGLPAAWAAKECDSQVEPVSILKRFNWQSTHKPLGTKGSTDAAKSFLTEFLKANDVVLTLAIESRSTEVGRADRDGLTKLDGPFKWTRKSKSKPKGDLAERAIAVRMFKYQGQNDKIDLEIDVADGKDGQIFIADIRLRPEPSVPKSESDHIAVPEHLAGRLDIKILETLTFPLHAEPPPARRENEILNTHLPLRIGAAEGAGNALSFVRKVHLTGEEGEGWMRFEDAYGRKGWMGVTGEREADGMIGLAYYDGDLRTSHLLYEGRPLVQAPTPANVQMRVVLMQPPRPAAPPAAKKKVVIPEPAYRAHGAAKISGAELKKMLAKYALPKSEIDGNEISRFASTLEAFNGLESGNEDLIPKFPAYLMGDLKKVKVGFANLAFGARDGDEAEPEVKRLVGIRTLSNGLTYLGMQVSNDTEVPTFIAIYFDGQDLRVYVPYDGNPYNDEENRQYGMDELDKDWINAVRRFPEAMKGHINDGDMTLDQILKFDAHKIEADLLRNLPVSE